MSITNDAIKHLQDNGIRVVDRRGKALGGNNHNRSLSGLRRGGFHWDGVSGGTIEGHERHWRNTNKWGDGGYTAFIDDAGTVFMNYDFEKRTNGVGNHNTPTLNVCYAGTYSNPMNDKQRRAAKIFWTFVVDDKRTNINSFNDIWGHNEFPGHSSNSCPGVDMNVFRNYLKDGKVKPASNPEPKPSPQIAESVSGAKLVKYENSTFTANTAIKVRNAPSTKATHTGTLKKGQSINYNAVYEGNGYRWLRYNSTKGVRYLPYRPSNDIKNQWGTFESSEPISKPKTLHLPKTVEIWRVYKPNGPYTIGNEVGRLAPKRYGGLNYTIQKEVAPHVYIIKSAQLGTVAIYAHPDTGAKIK